jgi:hypothetical protein
MAADEIREAYLKGAVALGVNLEEEVCCDYEDDYLPIEIYRIFESAGFGVSEWSLGWMGKPLSDRDRKNREHGRDNEEVFGGLKKIHSDGRLAVSGGI